MRLRIKFKLLFALLCLLSSTHLYGQTSVAESNPGEWAAIEKGELYLNETIGQQTKMRSATTTELGAMFLANKTMAKWERNYIQYLQKGYAFADQVLASVDVFMQAFNTFKNLKEISSAVTINPQGPFATMGMNNLYVEVGVEFLECFKLINLVKNRATTNLMNGSERARLIWMVSDKIRKLNTKLHRLAISICCYNFEDVWNRATMGMVQKSHRQLAKEARSRWERAFKNISQLYMKK